MTKSHKIILGLAILALVSLTAAFALNSGNGSNSHYGSNGNNKECSCKSGYAAVHTDCSKNGDSCEATAACESGCECCEGGKTGNCTCEDCKCCGCCNKQH